MERKADEKAVEVGAGEYSLTHTNTNTNTNTDRERKSIFVWLCVLYYVRFVCYIVVMYGVVPKTPTKAQQPSSLHTIHVN